MPAHHCGTHGQRGRQKTSRQTRLPNNLASPASFPSSPPQPAFGPARMEASSSSTGQRTCLTASTPAKPHPQPSQTRIPFSVKFNLFPEANRIPSDRTTSASLKPWNPKCGYLHPSHIQPFTMVIAGCIRWGPFLHYKLPMNGICVHFSGSF